MKGQRIFIGAPLLAVLVLLLLTGLTYAYAQGQGALSGPAAWNDPGTGFTYQGFLTHDGDPVDDTCDFRFGLWDAESGGAQVGPTLSRSGVAVSEGRFTVQLDFGDLFDGRPLWLEVAVQCPGDGDYTSLVPRQPLTPAPYAGYARSTGSLQGHPVTATVPVTGQVLKWDGTVWAPAADTDTTYSAGEGLVLEGTTFRADTGYLQRRVGGTCAAGSSIRVVNADGTVVCEADTDTTYSAGNQLSLSGTTFNVVEGAGSGLDADLLDGQHGSYYRDASNINAGTLDNARFSAYGDLSAEGYLDNNASTDLLTRSQADGRFVNEGQTNSVTSGMIVNGAVTASDMQDGAALAEILDDDGSGSGLDADLLDGQHASAFASASHNHDNRYWMLTGNAGTTPGTNFLGTTDSQPLELRVNGSRALRLEPNSTSPNVIGGYSGNSVAAGVWAATIGGGGSSGSPNRVTAGSYTTIGGGRNNTVSAHYATVGGGLTNTASGYSAAVGGGQNNTASGSYATVGGGAGNTASGSYATVGGGVGNTAGGDYSFAAGRRAQANNQGCFVWGDSTNADVSCSTDNRTIFRSSGGYYIYTNSGLTAGVYLAASGSSWNSVSDRERKENFRPVDTQALLENLAAIEISTWNYKGQDPSIRHIGPMAQDFNGLLPDLGGEGEEYINSLDADGVALAAIQGLYQLSQEQAAHIETLEAENAELRERLAEVEARLDVLEASIRTARPLQGDLLPGLGAFLAGVGLVWAMRRGGVNLPEGGGR